ncbi:hypothetical protein [Salipiger sp.]|uniref:hypothetical protein n=1 Tax=Salipiger sp. TaxID=2078585 RepID=UPI003A984CFA
MKPLLVAAVLATFAAPAFAFHCPEDMAAIDAALPGATLSAEALAEVKALRARGEAEHAAGNHGASVETLAKAKALLGL